MTYPKFWWESVDCIDGAAMMGGVERYKYYFIDRRSIPRMFLTSPDFVKFVEARELPLLDYENLIENTWNVCFRCLPSMHTLYSGLEYRARNIANDYTQCVITGAARKFYLHKWVNVVEI